MSLFNPDSKIMIALGKAGDFMILGILWVICSIPIITIGASTTAFFFGAFKVLNEEAYIVKAFFRSFKQNFKQATLLWLTALVVILLGIVVLQYYYHLDSPISSIGLAFMILFMIICVFTMLYLFPYLSKFYCSFKSAIRDSLLLSAKHLSSTLLMIFVDVAVILIALYFSAIIMFLPSIICLLNSIILKRIFDKYIPQDASNSDNEDTFMTIDEIDALDMELVSNVEQADTETAD